MELKTIIQSRGYLIVVLVLVAITVLFLTFSAGMYVGYRKAEFSYQWGENYHQNFVGPRVGLFRNLGGKDFIDSHGMAGQVIKIDGSTVIIKGSDGVEKSVIVSDDTTLRRFNETMKLSDLKIDDFVVIIGLPNNVGQIDAKFIRVLPSATSTMPMPGAFMPSK